MNEILTKMTRVEEDKEPFVKALPQYPYRGTMAANEGLGVDLLEDIHHTDKYNNRHGRTIDRRASRRGNDARGRRLHTSDVGWYVK